jgi:hypothetical protein
MPTTESPIEHVQPPRRRVLADIMTTDRRIAMGDIGKLKDIFVRRARVVHEIQIRDENGIPDVEQMQTIGSICVKYRMGLLHLTRGRLSFTGRVRTSSGSQNQDTSAKDEQERLYRQQAARDVLGVVFNCAACSAIKRSNSTTYGFDCPALDGAEIHIGRPQHGVVRVHGNMVAEKSFAIHADEVKCLRDRSQAPTMIAPKTTS